MPSMINTKALKEISRCVDLTGIPYYSQGSHDGMCAYYSATMFLAALRPEYQDLFGTSEDPVIGNMPYSKDSNRQTGKWFFEGAYLKPVCSALNKLFKNDSVNFKTKVKISSHRAGPSRQGVIDKIIEDIDSGFPVVLGWCSNERIGNHAIIVTGYEKFKSGSIWLGIQDPSGDTDIEVRQLINLKVGNLELIRCVDHNGWRPAKRTIRKSKDSSVLERRIEHWNSREKKYEIYYEWSIYNNIE